MFINFKQIKDYLIHSGTHTQIALAGADDPELLKALVMTRKFGLTDAILLGVKSRIVFALKEIGENPTNWEIVDCSDSVSTVTEAFKLSQGREVMPMKGMIHTADFMGALLDKRYGFRDDAHCIAQATVAELPDAGRLIIISDCAINIAPDVSKKIQIIKSSVKLAHRLGIPQPKIAIIAPLEVVNEHMQSTLDAAEIKKAFQNGEIPGCILDGPLGFDNAISPHAAELKQIESPVAGNADILIMPNLDAGNILTKALTHLANYSVSGNVIGTTKPVVMTSRTEKMENKINSILIALLQATEG